MAIFCKFQTEICISNFKNENFQIQISEMKIFKFSWCISIFSFPFGGMAKIFKFQKQKFSIQISKMKNFHFKLFLWHKRFFFLAQGCQIY
jgi:hypothetical protein